MAEILLLGVTGSRAFDLDHPGSDADRTGVFAAPTRDVLVYSKLRETLPAPDSDGVLHEARKFVSLAMVCNPSALELLWLDSYEHWNDHGMALRAIRDCFLSADAVRKSYLKFADAQVRKAANRLWREGKFGYEGPAITEARLRKHWRHTARLVISGSHLWRTGEVKVRMDASDKAYIETVETAGLDAARKMIRDMTVLMETAPTSLPEEPLHVRADEWLLAVREHYWDGRKTIA